MEPIFAYINWGVTQVVHIVSRSLRSWPKSGSGFWPGLGNSIAHILNPCDPSERHTQGTKIRVRKAGVNGQKSEVSRQADGADTWRDKDGVLPVVRSPEV